MAIMINIQGMSNMNSLGNMVQGNGKIVEKKVDDISPDLDIQTLLAQGAVRVNLDIQPQHKGKTSMSIVADENILPLIHIRQQGNRVSIENQGNYSSATVPCITLYCSGLQKLDMSGATSASGTVMQEKFKLDLSGSSKIDLYGEVKDFRVQASGASKVIADTLLTHSAVVEVSGASKVSIWAEANVSINASGASKVSVYGDKPNMTKSTSGAAKVESIYKPHQKMTAPEPVSQSVKEVEKVVEQPVKSTRETEQETQTQKTPFRKYI